MSASLLGELGGQKGWSHAMQPYSTPQYHSVANSCYYTGKLPLIFDLQGPHPFIQIPCVLCSHLGLIIQTSGCLSMSLAS